VNPAVIFILITVMIDAMGIGLMVPVMPDLIQEVNGGSIGNAAIWGLSLIHISEPTRPY